MVKHALVIILSSGIFMGGDWPFLMDFNKTYLYSFEIKSQVAITKLTM